MNTAIALAMLGADCHFLGRLSTDQFGRQLRGHLVGAGVDLDLAATSDLPTSLAMVSLDDERKASYHFYLDQTSNFGWRPDELPDLAEQDWLHIGSFALIVPPDAKLLLDWVSRVSAPVSIDINVRPAVIGDPVEYWSRVEPWLQAVGSDDVIKASDDDVTFLARALDPPGGWRSITEGWFADYRPGVIVITRGECGASALTTAGWIDVPGIATSVVDTVGAGDTFMAGFLDGHVRLGVDLETALRRGVAAASIVCSRQGAQPPTAAEIDPLLSA
jgi:fructokinase